jgi:hypothetical protein
MALLIMFAAGAGTITAVVTLAAVHTPDVTAIVAALIGAGVTFGALVLAIKSGHPGDRYPLHGAHRGLDGNAIRIGRPEGVLSHLGSSVSLIDTDFG